MEFILYSYFRSSASFRVRIALNLKAIKYEYRPVHLLNNGGEQNSAEYSKLNPSRQVPTLVHNGRPLGQSMAIIDYLDSIKPEPALFPKDAFARALCIQACEIINSGTQPLVNTSVTKQLEMRFLADQLKKDEWVQHWIKYGLESFDKFIQPHAGSFSFGNSVSAADCFLIPHLASSDRFKVSLDGYPLLQKIRASCLALEAFKLAGFDAQPDTPK